MIERIMRVLKLDKTVFPEIAGDANATTQAGIIVVVVSLLTGIGAGFQGSFFGNLIWQLIAGVVLGWLLWAVVTYFVGTSLFEGKTTVEAMLRVLGYASAPRLLGFFSFIPCVGPILSLAGAILSLVAGFIAVREAMQFDTGKAVITVVIGWLAYLVLTIVLAPILGLGYAVFG
jgi:hypothetical protein